MIDVWTEKQSFVLYNLICFLSVTGIAKNFAWHDSPFRSKWDLKQIVEVFIKNIRGRLMSVQVNNRNYFPNLRSSSPLKSFFTSFWMNSFHSSFEFVSHHRSPRIHNCHDTKFIEIDMLDVSFNIKISIQHYIFSTFFVKMK